jgi:uncharacterized membrane protein HdeD (DUF308 family)
MSEESADTARARIEEVQRALHASVRRHRWLFLVEGVVFLLLGLAAIVFPHVASVAVALFVGWLFLIGGGVQLVTTFASRDAPVFGWRLAAALLAIVLGALLLWNPAAGVLTLTAVLTGYLLAVGVLRALAALGNRDMPHWGALLFSGLVSIALAVLILLGLPLTATWVLGLIAGIELVFAGAAILSLVWRTWHDRQGA